MMHTYVQCSTSKTQAWSLDPKNFALVIECIHALLEIHFIHFDKLWLVFMKTVFE